MNLAKSSSMPRYEKRMEGEMVSQCPVCRTVEVKREDGRGGSQSTFVVFKNLPQKKCYQHRNIK